MLINAKRACEVLGIKMPTLYYWSQNNMIPIVRIGKLLKFEEIELLDWFKSGKFEKRRLQVKESR